LSIQNDVLPGPLITYEVKALLKAVGGAVYAGAALTSPSTVDARAEESQETQSLLVSVYQFSRGRRTILHEHQPFP
ncbi:MAG TPA: hypothetical protein VMS31_14000, partial [Pyrinomonadaceae bacterium]|nr:hypothetical protein [Pyrinomonadaceae bacterium]